MTLDRMPSLNSVCGICGGPCYAKRTPMLGEYTVEHGEGVWLHLNQDDWKDNPHNAEPRSEDAQTLRERIAAQSRTMKISNVQLVATTWNDLQKGDLIVELDQVVADVHVMPNDQLIVRFVDDSESKETDGNTEVEVMRERRRSNR